MLQKIGYNCSNLVVKQAPGWLSKNSVSEKWLPLIGKKKRIVWNMWLYCFVFPSPVLAILIELFILFFWVKPFSILYLKEHLKQLIRTLRLDWKPACLLVIGDTKWSKNVEGWMFSTKQKLETPGKFRIIAITLLLAKIFVWAYHIG